MAKPSDWRALKTYISQIKLSNMIKRDLQNIDSYVRNLHRLFFSSGIIIIL